MRCVNLQGTFVVILTCYCNVYDVFLLKILKPYGEEEKGR